MDGIRTVQRAAVVAALFVAGISSPVLAQAGAGGEGAAPAPAPWGATCSSSGRGTPPDCVMEQRVVMSNSGQLLAAVTVRMPADSQTPVLMIRTPFGLHLPAGLKLAVDDQPVVTLPLQTCDASGCYAGDVITPELLAALKQGTTLSVTFQDTAQRDIAVPVSLNGFSAAYDRIQQ